MSNSSLCALLRQTYSNLHRVAQLELQLFESLFFEADDGKEGERAPGVAMSRATDIDSRDVLALVEGASSLVGDALRPIIIHQNSVDELCRAISVLSEDVRSHTINARLPVHLRKELLRGLDRTIYDAQERLSFCAEVALRQHIVKFVPLPSHVTYPDILEAAKEAQTQATESTVTSALTSDENDVSRTWYPSLKQTLALLSKLYGVAETGVFEDFARRAVEECVQSLQRGSEAVKKKSSSDLIASLFLVRHLLVLREQLMPFDIRLQGTEKRLDFKTTGEAFTQLRSLGGISGALKLSSANGLLRFAREGLPQLQESLLDVKGELDRVLKLACGTLRDAALKMLIGAELDGLLAKVQAFVGDIPVQRATASAQGEPSSLLAAPDQAAPPLAAELAAKLRNQAFLRPERLLAVLNDAQQALQHTLPELRRLMALHIDSSVARVILLKPVTQELELQKMKMLSVVTACVDPGQNKRDIEQLLSAIHDGITSELASTE